MSQGVIPDNSSLSSLGRFQAKITKRTEALAEKYGCLFDVRRSGSELWCVELKHPPSKYSDRDLVKNPDIIYLIKRALVTRFEVKLGLGLLTESNMGSTQHVEPEILY